MLVLGIETSCDETGVALYHSERGLLAHRLHSQIAVHAPFGGVVPELAARDHVRRLPGLLNDVLEAADCARADIDGVAYTAGPGLMGALLVGTSCGRSIAYALDVPALAVHHMEAHLLAAMMDDPDLGMPFLALLVSGGHTQLVAVRGIGDYELLGDTLDDAAGEAFDKTATVLGLGYPGGPAVAALAEQGDPDRFRFARPMTDRPGLDFSFSGLKTQVLTTVQRTRPLEPERAHIARGFEEAVVDTLVIKCRRALQQTGMTHLVLAGGVAANRRLRARMQTLAKGLAVQVHYPALDFCTDNGAMIAYAGCQRLLAGESADMSCAARARWPLHEMQPPGQPR